MDYLINNYMLRGHFTRIFFDPMLISIYFETIIVEMSLEETKIHMFVKLDIICIGFLSKSNNLGMSSRRKSVNSSQFVTHTVIAEQ